MRMQERINRGVKAFIRPQGEVATPSRRNQIVVAATNSQRTASASAGGCSESMGAQAKTNIAQKNILRQVDMFALWWLNALR
jgi:hypothetical protein